MAQRLPLLTLLFTLFVCTGGRAQTLTGTVTDRATGEPLPFASIYVQETQSGAATNNNGRYAVRLAPGQNTVVFQYLGYQTTIETVSGSRTLDVAMDAQTLELETIEIVEGGEDISYSVIRRAIAKADYHLNQVDEYSADVYIKGTGKVTKVGGAIRAIVGKDAREDIDESIDRPFTTESTSRVTYTRPNTYTQDVKQVYTVGDEGFDANDYIFTTFYQPLIAETAVSPLHPRAFGYYRFELLGVFSDQGQLVNKIAVYPRSPGEDVFEGTINIIQDDWSIHSLDLTTPKLNFKINIQQQYAKIQEHLWMPVATKLRAAGSILGISLEYNYVSTIGDYDVKLNDELAGYVEVIDEKTQPEIAARTAKKRDVNELEEALGNGEEITRKDLRRLMKSYRKQEREESDEPDVISNYTRIDSNAVVVSDSAAWDAVRPIPLTDEEKRGYMIADSVARSQVQSEDGEDSMQGRADSLKVTSSSGKKRPAFRRRSLAPLPIFNPVEGLALGGRVVYGNAKKKYGFALSPRYGFGWKRGTFDGEILLGHSGERGQGDPFKTPRYRLSGGRSLRQFNDNPSIDPWLSTYFNLFNGNNFIRLYERAYGQFDYKKWYGDELYVTTTLAYEDRRAVRNSSDFNIFGLDDEEVYAANLPINRERGAITEVNPAATFEVGLSWRPGLRYNIRNGRKELIPNSAPELGARLRQGIPGVGESTADFTEVQLSYQHRFDVGRKGRAQVLARGGYFLNNSFVDFPDFRHFEGSEVALVAADPLESYRLLPYYAESTDEEYLELYAHYQFRKFLLTQIRAIHLLGIREDLFVNYLYTPTSDHYTELGYSLDGIFRIFRLEFVTAYRDGRYEDFGVRFGVATALSNIQIN